eukprot:12198785-Heterocapsa_arctica.AAC.1
MPCPHPSVVQGMPGRGCSKKMGHCPASSSWAARAGSLSGAAPAMEPASLRVSSESDPSSSLSGCHTRLICPEISAMFPCAASLT